MGQIIKNLGQISAVFTGTTSPDNKNLLWIDTTTNPAVKKIWDAVSCSWESMTPENIIEQHIVQLSGDGSETSFSFVHDLQLSDYDYTVQIDIEDTDGFLVQNPTVVLKRTNDVFVTFASPPDAAKAIRCIIHFK